MAAMNHPFIFMPRDDSEYNVGCLKDKLSFRFIHASVFIIEKKNLE